MAEGGTTVRTDLLGRVEVIVGDGRVRLELLERLQAGVQHLVGVIHGRWCKVCVNAGTMPRQSKRHHRASSTHFTHTGHAETHVPAGRCRGRRRSAPSTTRPRTGRTGATCVRYYVCSVCVSWRTRTGPCLAARPLVGRAMHYTQGSETPTHPPPPQKNTHGEKTHRKLAS